MDYEQLSQNLEQGAASEPAGFWLDEQQGEIHYTDSLGKTVDVDDARAVHLLNEQLQGVRIELKRQVDVRLEKLSAENTTLQAKITEALELIREALNDADFQPCFDSKNHRTGPALRGTLERAEDALVEVAGKDASSASPDARCTEMERLLRVAHATVCGEDPGDGSLEYFRRTHAPEPHSLLISIELELAGQMTERAELERRLGEEKERGDDNFQAFDRVRGKYSDTVNQLRARDAEVAGLRGALVEYMNAMRRYEMDCDADQPYEHREMRQRADAALAAARETEGEG